MWELFTQAAWKVLAAGLLLGAGLPAVFALGVRLSAPRVASGAGTAGATAGATVPSGGSRAVGVLCFAAVAVAVALGITVIVAAGLGQVVSFEQGYPTLVPKA
jgi:hypothetical protein